MSVGAATSGGATVLDVGAIGSPADNTFVRTDTVAGATQPYWPCYWRYTPSQSGVLTLDAGVTGGSNPDTFLKLRLESMGPSEYLAADDDSGLGRTSLIRAYPVTAGTTYIVELGSYDDTGNTITTYHLAATFTVVPILPNPRVFSLVGGSLTDPGLVMGPAVVGAPVASPLSVSLPTDGTTPDATFVFDTASLDVDTAFISFDAMLSYSTLGFADTTTPPVGLNVFSVPHGLPFTWEEDWDTVEIGASSGTDDYGRIVPRGQYTLYAERGTTYIIQLTTPPGNEVRFVLRVSEWGAHTGDTAIPDQAWRVTGEPGNFVGSGAPTVYPSGEPVYCKNAALSSMGTHDLTNGVAEGYFSRVFAGFFGHKELDRGFAATHYPGTDPNARDCLWAHARRVKNLAVQYWTADGTVSGADSPVCQAVLSSAGSADNVKDGSIGWKYQSTTIDVSGHEVAHYDVRGSVFRANLSNILARFGATAGVDPSTFEAPDGYTNTSPILSGPVTGAPDLLGFKVRTDQLSGGSTAAVTPRFYLKAADDDNTDAHTPTTWGPALESDSSDWHGGTGSSPEGFAALQDLMVDGSTWTAIPDATVTAAMADEAAGPTDGTYTGGLRVTGLFTEQFSDTPPSGPAMTFGETVTRLTTGVYPILQIALRPTVTYRFADLPEIPVAIPEGFTAEGDLGQVRRRFYAMS